VDNTKQETNKNNKKVNNSADQLCRLTFFKMYGDVRQFADLIQVQRFFSLHAFDAHTHFTYTIDYEMHDNVPRNTFFVFILWNAIY